MEKRNHNCGSPLYLPYHDRLTEPKDENDVPMQQIHTHVVLPGTAPSVAERLPVYNNKERGHDVLFRDIATRHFEAALDDIVGPEWRNHREQETEITPLSKDLDEWFPRR